MTEETTLFREAPGMDEGSSQNSPKMDPYVPHPYRILWVPHKYFTEVTGPTHLHLPSAVLPTQLQLSVPSS